MLKQILIVFILISFVWGQEDEPIETKNPVIAVGLSVGGSLIVLNGLGQVYNEEYLKAAGFFGSGLAGFILMMVEPVKSGEYNKGGTVEIIGKSMYIVSAVWAAIDAGYYANKITVTPAYKNERIYVQLSYQF